MVPGNNPQAAVTAFLKPLQRALSVLDGHGQISAVRRGGYEKNKPYGWVINSGNGMTWPGVGLFDATMSFMIVDADPNRHGGRPGQFTVSTRGYWYRFRAAGSTEDAWRIHWHPVGKSRFRDPHIHIPPDLQAHFPSPRIPFEQAIRWCRAAGAPLACGEQQADDQLTESETGFRLYRSWSDITSDEYGTLKKSLPPPGESWPDS